VEEGGAAQALAVKKYGVSSGGEKQALAIKLFIGVGSKFKFATPNGCWIG
jgi:hypothetical protein